MAEYLSKRLYLRYSQEFAALDLQIFQQSANLCRNSKDSNEKCTVSGKKRPKYFCNIAVKLGQLWWNLVHSFSNKFATKSCKRLPPHLNNISTLPCETWHAHRARSTVELLDRETPEFIPPQLWHPNSPDLNQLITACGKYCKRGIQHMCHWSAAIDDATGEWLLQWRCDPARSVHSVLRRCFSSSRSVMRVLYTFSCSISSFHTL